MPALFHQVSAQVRCPKRLGFQSHSAAQICQQFTRVSDSSYFCFHYVIIFKFLFHHFYYLFFRIKPVKLAYTSYESTKDDEQQKLAPILIMHGLFGSKNNWNTLSKAIHQSTKRKVRSKVDKQD